MPPAIAKMWAKIIIFINNIAIIWELLGRRIQNFLSKKRKYVILDIGNFFLVKPN